ncbi:CHAT domain-containing protein [Runella sp.]|uniref:CHAT domain-containing protein n=1 Tax=Runella sp. TaxID=1960881 RepID=UPI0030199655
MKRPAIYFSILFSSLLISILIAQSKQLAKPLYEDRIESLYKANLLDKGLALVDSIMPEVKKQKDWRAFAIYEGQYAKILKEQKRYDIAISRLGDDIALLRANGLGDSEYTGSLWVWKAMQYQKLQRFSENLEAYQNAIQCYEKQKSLYKNLAFAYKNIAQVYLRFSDNHLAIKNLEAAMRSDTGKVYFTSICSQLAASYVYMDSITKSEEYFNMIDLDHAGHYAASVFSTGTEIALRKNDIKLAESYALKALDAYMKEPDQIEDIILTYANLAEAFAKRGNITAAKKYFEKAESLWDPFQNEQKSREMAKFYNKFGSFYENLNQREAALHCFQSALIQVFPNFNTEDWHINPSLKDISPESQIAFAAESKARLLLGVANPSLQIRKIAAECYSIALNATDQLRKRSFEEIDKFDMIRESRNWMVMSIENLVEIGKIAPDTSINVRLLQNFELSKSQALRDAINQKSLFDYIPLPDSIRANEKLLRAEIVDYKKNILEENFKGVKPDSVKLNLLNTELFRTEFAYRELIDQLKTEHPAFGAQLAAEPVLNVDSLRASLPDSAAILSFFDTGNRYLLLTTTRKGIELNEIPCDTAFKNLLSGFIQRLSDRSAQENDPERYYQDAWLLYQKLLPAKALAGIRSLTIIPDGALCYLPFEALLTQAYKGSYARAPYLMRAYNVAYNWSAAIPLQAGKGGRGMLQVAPFTNSARDGLAVLPNSRLEADNHIHLQSLTDSAASAAAFSEKSSDYMVLHIATHAQAGGQNLPRVEFFDRSLSAQEIYGLRLNASLVSLSACETGAGKYAGGEGVLSLARAFAAVGARSLVASHWTVNEFSTAQLFKSFYTYLFAGQTKSASLRAAKLAYLDSETPDARKAPFYWAAFTLTGADGKVDFGGGFQWWYLWVALGVIGAVLIIRRIIV